MSRRATLSNNISRRTNAFCLLCILKLLMLASAAKKDVNVKKSLVFGPAFDREIVLPVRYFYIQLVDKKGKKYVLFISIWRHAHFLCFLKCSSRTKLQLSSFVYCKLNMQSILYPPTSCLT